MLYHSILINIYRSQSASERGSKLFIFPRHANNKPFDDCCLLCILVRELTEHVVCVSRIGEVTAQRQVAVQEGPLYRTEGSHITIWCNVSGYQGPSEQNFQWSIYLPSAPEREVQIVSTVDSSFPYAIYTQRVRGGKIYVERVQDHSALLHITELQARDAGEYECHTPNTDERYFGSYSAKMNLVGKETSASPRPRSRPGVLVRSGHRDSAPRTQRLPRRACICHGAGGWAPAWPVPGGGGPFSGGQTADFSLYPLVI